MMAQLLFVQEPVLILELVQVPHSLVLLAAMQEKLAPTALRRVVEIARVVVTRLLVAVMSVRLENMGRLLGVFWIVLPTVVLQLDVKTTATAQNSPVNQSLRAKEVNGGENPATNHAPRQPKSAAQVALTLDQTKAPTSGYAQAVLVMRDGTVPYVSNNAPTVKTGIVTRTAGSA
jgi:hypothetical protein